MSALAHLVKTYNIFSYYMFLYYMISYYIFSYYMFSDSVQPLALPEAEGFSLAILSHSSPSTAFCIPCGFLAPKGFWILIGFLDHPSHRIFRCPMGFCIKNWTHTYAPNGFLDMSTNRLLCALYPMPGCTTYDPAIIAQTK